MTWVKVCGITSEAARDAAVESGADAVGFVLAPSSPRAVDVATARALITGVEIGTFLVTVDMPPDDLVALVEATGARGVQPHGAHRHDVAVVALSLGLDVLLPVAVGAAGPRDEVDEVARGAIPLLDTADDGVHGGTGRVFAWDLVAGLHRPFVLAGGLGPDNVADAIHAVRPWGVDASSRLESAPGVKDPDTIRAFVARARAAGVRSI